MSELPKIVRAHLGSQRADGHPDADVLTAFYEQVLPEKERGPVLAHLAQCSECREVVVLALPAVEETRVRVAKEPESLWNWSLVRWGSLVACLVVVGAAVFIHPKPGPVAVRPTSEAEVVIPERAAAKPSTEEKVVANVTQAPQQKLRADEARKETVAASQQGARIANIPSLHESAKPAAPANQHTLGVTAVGRMPSPDVLPQAMAGNVSAVVNKGAVASPSAPTLTAKPMVAEGAKADKSGESAELKLAEVPGKAKGGTVSGAAQVVVPAESDGILDSLAPAQWILSPEGQLQRSFDGGKTWEPVPVVERAKFSALSALGPDVWVGGAAGVLYHSADNGTHWTLVKPSAEGVVLTGDIAGLHFTDPQHGALKTSDGQEWSTADGGRNWQTKP